MSDLESALPRVVREAASSARGPGAEAVVRRRHRQRWQRWSGALTAALVVAGGGAVLAGHSGRAASTDTIGAGGSPAALVGLWHVDEGGRTDEAISLGSDLQVFEACGTADGAWGADAAGEFVAVANSEEGGDCPSTPDFLPSWLRSVTSWRSAGSARELLGGNGEVVARLTPGARPRTSPDDPSPARRPVLDASLRAALSEPAPLPAGVTAATAATLVGRWVPAPAAGNHTAYLTFGNDRVLEGSDGCNGLGSRWTSGPAGRLLALPSAETEVGCNNSPVLDWVTSAGRAGFTGGLLVLYDHAGHELGRLRRDEHTHRVTGVLELLGGPAPGGRHPFAGVVRVSVGGAVRQVSTSRNGAFALDLPDGRYTVRGGLEHPAPHQAPAGPDVCRSTPVVVHGAAVAGVAVACVVP